MEALNSIWDSNIGAPYASVLDGQRENAMTNNASIPPKSDDAEPAHTMDDFVNHQPNRRYFDADGEIDLREAGLVLNAVMWISFMAFPKFWAILPEVPQKAHLLILLDEYLPYAYSQRCTTQIPEGEQRPDTSNRGPLATQLRELVAVWEPPNLTTDMRETARSLLRADGVAEPNCGWDEYAPSPDFPSDKMLLGPNGFNRD